MTKPTTELACRDVVTGLRITVDGSMHKVEMPKNAILTGLYAAIGCTAVDVVRVADQLDMWIDDEGLYNSQANPLATTLAHHFQRDIPPRYRQPYFGTAVLLGIDQATGETLGMLGAAGLTAAELTQLHSALNGE
ncbi:MAG: DUF3846 domain-containing protein [Pseudonocardiaceae bacterium]